MPDHERRYSRNAGRTPGHLPGCRCSLCVKPKPRSTGNAPPNLPVVPRRPGASPADHPEGCDCNICQQLADILSPKNRPTDSAAPPTPTPPSPEPPTPTPTPPYHRQNRQRVQERRQLLVLRARPHARTGTAVGLGSLLGSSWRLRSLAMCGLRQQSEAGLV